MMAAAGMPLLGMGLFLAWREWMGFPSYFYLQETTFLRVFSAPWETVWILLQEFPEGFLRNWVLGLNTLELVVAVAAVIGGWRFLPLALNVYQVVFLFFILSSRMTNDPLVCFNRYIMVLFPMFLVMGRLEMGKMTRLIYFGVSLLLVLGVSAMFFMWKWVG